MLICSSVTLNKKMKLQYFFFLIILNFSCKNSSQNRENTAPIPSNLSGKELAQSYCASCHQYPEPNLLDKNTWKNGVLPKMYARLGLEQDGFNIFSEMDSDDMMAIIKAGIYPEQPTIHKNDWAKIVKFYLDNSPEKPLPQAKKAKVSNNLALFKLKKLFISAENIPAITMVKFNPADKSIYLGKRAQPNYIKKFSTDFKPIDSTKVNSPVSDIYLKNGKLNWLEMGLMDPNDQRKGKFITNKKVVQDSLQRPVNISFGDLNNDKIDDYVICNFGNELGNLIWYDGKTNNPNILNEVPGARLAYIQDLNNDGLNDIAVLMTQANEQIVYYLNRGKGQFEAKTILRFPPVYGSSFFQLIDFDKDGHLDILYANGDNADLSISLKKYHGVRIYTNNGNFKFVESYFYPMYGASKALAADFDLDGDLDIAAISFFTEPTQKPNEGFIYFQNNGKSFVPSTFIEAKLGKWMTMDIADMDTDGDIDIVIGSFKIKEPRPALNAKREIDAIVLENKTKNIFK